MDKHIEEKLLLYLYDELTPEETDEIRQLIERSPEIEKEYSKLKSVCTDYRNAEIPQISALTVKNTISIK